MTLRGSSSSTKSQIDFQVWSTMCNLSSTGSLWRPQAGIRPFSAHRSYAALQHHVGDLGMNGLVANITESILTAMIGLDFGCEESVTGAVPIGAI